MTQKILVSIVPTAPYDENMKALVENNRTIQEEILGRAFNILSDVEETTQINTTSSSFADISGFAVGAKSSGGLMVIEFTTTATVDAASITGTLQLLLDGAVKDSCNMVSAGASYNNRCGLRWVGKPTEGNHKIQVQFKTSGGTFGVSVNSTHSKLTVVEYL